MSLNVFVVDLREEVRFRKKVARLDNRCTATKLCKCDLCVAQNFLDSIVMIIIICFLVKLLSRYLVVRLLCCYTVIVLMAV